MVWEIDPIMEGLKQSFEVNMVKKMKLSNTISKGIEITKNMDEVFQKILVKRLTRGLLRPHQKLSIKK